MLMSHNTRSKVESEVFEGSSFFLWIFRAFYKMRGRPRGGLANEYQKWYSILSLKGLSRLLLTGSIALLSLNSLLFSYPTFSKDLHSFIFIRLYLWLIFNTFYWMFSFLCFYSLWMKILFKFHSLFILRHFVSFFPLFFSFLLLWISETF